MRKQIYLVFSFILIAILFINGNIVEAGKQELSVKQLTPYFGINYNTYDLGIINQRASSYGSDDINSGSGFYIGVKQRLSEKDMGWGLEFEKMEIDYEGSDLLVSNTGLFAKKFYQLSELHEGFLENLYLTAAVGIYRSELNDGVLNEVKKFSGPGVKLGIEGPFFVHKNIIVGGRINYRYSRPHSEGELDFSGFETAFQIKINY